MDAVYELNTVVIETVAENGKRISLVLILLDLLSKILISLHDKDLDSGEINTMFNMLALRPDLSKSKFPDLNDVMNFIPQSYRKHIASVLATNFYRVITWNILTGYM